MITPRLKRKIKNSLCHQPPTMWIGKEGSTIRVINEIKKQLDAREMIKIRILKTALEEEKAKDIGKKIAEKTDSELVEVRGHTLLLFKKKKKK